MSDSASSVVKPLNLVASIADESESSSQGCAAPVVAMVLAPTPAGVLIDVAGRQVEARIAVADSVEDAVGSEVLVSFIDADPNQPVVTGLLRAPGSRTREHQDKAIEFDAERLCMVARHELVLRCGKGSIRLTRDGRIVIDGVQLISRAEGANRIRGGTIHLN